MVLGCRVTAVERSEPSGMIEITVADNHSVRSGAARARKGRGNGAENHVATDPITRALVVEQNAAR